jgi:FixJ family two-component response regulator
MPGGMTGRDLADAALRVRPGLPVLFTSGYTANTMVHRGRLDPGVCLLGKPYRRAELARKLREALGRGSPRPSAPRPDRTTDETRT